MEHYVTLFDRLFLPQGIALHLSMERHAGCYALWVLCVDDATFEVLKRLDLPNVRLLQFSRLETDDLKKVKPTRTTGEYCWTITPFAPRFVFDADRSVNRVTYVDADMWFRKDPSPIFREFEASGKQVLITDHAYAAEYDRSCKSGQYCVQFMPFNRDGGEEVRRYWERRCLEWCYARSEDGKFGDQKYLDDWPERFPSQVHVLSRQDWILAPWNTTRFPYNSAICHHFHNLRILDLNRYVLGPYAIPAVVIEQIYKPYAVDLKRACAKLRAIGQEPMAQHEAIRWLWIRRIKAVILGIVEFRWHYAPARVRRL